MYIVICDDIIVNLDVIDELMVVYDVLDLILVEFGGDNFMVIFFLGLVDV